MRGDPEPVVAASPMTLEILGMRTQQILDWQRKEDRRRMWGLIFTVGGALFAAVKLGFIVLPHIRKKPHALGTLVPIANPTTLSRRRRRR